jgi:PPOX class probable F420-dependent enzyme
LVKVDLEKKSDFLRSGPPKLLRLAVTVDGKPKVSSVWYLWSDNHFWISTSEDRLKVKAIRKSPHVALIVDTDVMPYEGVIVEGEATLVKKDLEKITRAIVEKYVDQKYVKEEYDSLMRAPRILIKIKPDKALDIMSYVEH